MDLSFMDNFEFDTSLGYYDEIEASIKCKVCEEAAGLKHYSEVRKEITLSQWYREHYVWESSSVSYTSLGAVFGECLSHWKDKHEQQ